MNEKMSIYDMDDSYTEEVVLNKIDLSIIYDALCSAEYECAITLYDANYLLDKLGLENIY